MSIIPIMRRLQVCFFFNQNRRQSWSTCVCGELYFIKLCSLMMETPFFFVHFSFLCDRRENTNIYKQMNILVASKVYQNRPHQMNTSCTANSQLKNIQEFLKRIPSSLTKIFQDSFWLKCWHELSKKCLQSSTHLSSQNKLFDFESLWSEHLLDDFRKLCCESRSRVCAGVARGWGSLVTG